MLGNIYLLLDDTNNSIVMCSISQMKVYYKMYELVKERFLKKYGYVPGIPDAQDFYEHFKKCGTFSNGISMYSVKKLEVV